MRTLKLFSFIIAILVGTSLLTAVSFADEIYNFTAIPANSMAGEFTDYHLGFDVSFPDYAFLHRGEIEITFPEGFFLGALRSVHVEDNTGESDLHVAYVSVSGQTIKIGLQHQDRITDKTIIAVGNSVRLSVMLSRIQNSLDYGFYSVQVLGRNRDQETLFGLTNSDFFEIERAEVASILITPDTAVTLRAGDSITYGAIAYDQYGNILNNIPFEWSLVECTNCVGEMADSTLFVTRVGTGKVMARYDTVTAVSQTITALPGELTRMVLQVADTQFVKLPFDGDNSIILYDAYNNLKTDYNLTETPIELFLSEGILNRTVIANNNYLIGGVVRLNQVGLKYTGDSGEREIFCQSGEITSNSDFPSFNTYDILDALDFNGMTVTSVFNGNQTVLDIPVVNNGNIVPDSTMVIKARFTSHGLEQRATWFVPSMPGMIDTVTIALPVFTDLPVIDTIVIFSEAVFRTASGFKPTKDSAFFPVVVEDAAVLVIEPMSIKPDSITAAKAFPLSFSVVTEGLISQSDSTTLTASLDINGTDVFLFDGTLDAYLTQSESGFTYIDIPGYLDTVGLTVANGWYPLTLDYTLFVEGSIFTLEEETVDSLYVFADHGISYVENSLRPTTVFAGSDVQFVFDLNIESDLTYLFHSSQSSFTLFDENFSTTVRFSAESDTLQAGTVRFTSAPFTITSSLIGRNLQATAEFNFCVAGLSDTLIFSTDFENDGSISVEAPATVQVIDLAIDAPNQPRVNTNQEFLVHGFVANLSATRVDSVFVKLVSVENASSITEPYLTVHNLLPNDTAEVVFSVTAAPDPNSLPEVFRLDILSDHVDIEPPVNNVAFLFIDSPANLELLYAVDGVPYVDEVLVDYNENLNLAVVFNNIGTAGVTDGSYRLIIDGEGLEPDTMTGPMLIDSFLTFQYRTPSSDTRITFEFELVDIPIDVNTNDAAIIPQDSFIVNANVVSTAAELMADVTPLGSNLILPGRTQQLFSLHLRHVGTAASPAIEVSELQLQVQTLNGVDIDAQNLFLIGNCGYFEDGFKIAGASPDAGLLLFTFTDFVIEPGTETDLILQVDLKPTGLNAFTYLMDLNNISAVFAEGGSEGLPVQVASADGDPELINRQMKIKGATITESFVIENNPANPEDGPLQFAYELPVDTRIIFRVYTLTGELVYTEEFPAGNAGGASGENIISWDGRNHSGYMIMNGVYIAEIYNSVTRESARMKVAIVK